MTAAEQTYAIEGEQLTLEQIVERASRAGLERRHVRSRLRYGDRTLERLLRKPSNKPGPGNRVFFGRNRQGRK